MLIRDLGLSNGPSNWLDELYHTTSIKANRYEYASIMSSLKYSFMSS